MLDSDPGAPRHSRYRPTVIPVLLFALSVIFQTACTGEHPQEPLAPKVVIRMKAPPPSPAREESSPARPVPEDPEPGVFAGSPSERVTAPSPTGPATQSPQERGGLGAGMQSAEGSAARAIESRSERKPGLYRVRPGDTLSSISAREDVYGDPLKWTRLLRLNRENLVGLETSPDFPDRVLTEGMVLAYWTGEEATADPGRAVTDVWVVNVISSKTQGGLVPAALALIRRGFPVYITQVRVKGEDWLRLRVGFFGGRDEAGAVAERIAVLIGTGRPWVAKADPRELREFGG